MASSGNGGTRKLATEFPGLSLMIFNRLACLSLPIVSANESTISPYATSSASPFDVPLPLASSCLPPSTYAVTVAIQPPPFGE